MAETTPICNFGWKAPNFNLPGTDGQTYALADVMGPKGTLVMFICNHCPYVRAILDRMVRDARDLEALGIGVVAISSNDAATYPDDSFTKMQAVAGEMAFPFPYLYDESQAVARAYGAVCTPDFFGFDATGGLQYRGRLDESRKDAASPDVRRDLFEGMRLVSETGKGPVEQIPSIGCSIKWKAA